VLSSQLSARLVGTGGPGPGVRTNSETGDPSGFLQREEQCPTVKRVVGRKAAQGAKKAHSAQNLNFHQLLPPALSRMSLF